MEIRQRIEKIIKEVQKLIKVCYPNHDFKISFLTIFSQSDQDFEELRKILQGLGQESEANNGYKYKLDTPISYSDEDIELVRIRRPDVHRKELGCADLTYSEKDYLKYRDIALEKGFDITLRKDYEMIELSDFKIPAYVYLVKDEIKS